MNLVRIEISEETLNRLIQSKALNFSELELIKIEPKEYDYSNDPAWIDAKKTSTKAYKKLKEIEFNIREKQRGG